MSNGEMFRDSPFRPEDEDRSPLMSREALQELGVGGWSSETRSGATRSGETRSGATGSRQTPAPASRVAQVWAEIHDEQELPVEPLWSTQEGPLRPKLQVTLACGGTWSPDSTVDVRSEPHAPLVEEVEPAARGGWMLWLLCGALLNVPAAVWWALR